MAKGYKMGQSGGGINKTLPYQLTAFTAVADNTPQITLSWENPTEYWAGTLIVKKAGSAPEGVNDGEKIYNGTGTSFVDTAVEYDVTYFYRAFPYNAKKQYQTEVLTVSAMPMSGLPLSELAEGALVKINEGGTAVPFYLAKHDYESGLNGAGRQLMVRKGLYDKRKWSASDSPDYSTSDIDAWQNGDYKALFSDYIQSLMGETTIYYTNKSNFSISSITRSVFHLSASEMNVTEDDNYSSYQDKIKLEGSALPIANILAIAYLNGGAIRQWTRTYSTISNGVGVYDVNGNFNVYARTSSYGSRPCFTLPATALVDPTPNADGSYNLIEL